MVAAHKPLLELLRRLKHARYRFITVTPATHARVLSRPPKASPNLADIFGWNRPFSAEDLDPDLTALLGAAEALEAQEGTFRSRVRVASLGDDLVLHGAFPTESPDAVFFGPDSYRFARFIQQRLPSLGDGVWLVDMGAGSGAGAIAAARAGSFQRVTLVDVNPAALALAAINADSAGVRVETVLSDAIPRGPQLVIANPPYMIDRLARAYRDGGDLLGGAVALRWAEQALAGLAPGGTLLLYTGAAYSDGRSPLLEALASACAAAGASVELEEMDPDVFGDELDQPGYASVDRIAAVGAAITVRT